MNPTSNTLTPPEGFRQLGPEEVLEAGDRRMFVSPETDVVHSFETLDAGRTVGCQPEGKNPFIYIRKNENNS